jgi:hypothetical protein
MYVCKFVSSLLYSCFRNCFKKIYTAHHHCVEWISTDRTQYQFRSSYATTFSLSLSFLSLVYIYIGMHALCSNCLIIVPRPSWSAFIVLFYSGLHIVAVCGAIGEHMTDCTCRRALVLTADRTFLLRRNRLQTRRQ